jgi:hypothetical protein
MSDVSLNCFESPVGCDLQEIGVHYYTSLPIDGPLRQTEVHNLYGIYNAHHWDLIFSMPSGKTYSFCFRTWSKICER